MKQNRAKAGGEVGMNGMHYPGGTFLPNTTLDKGTPKARVKPVKLGKRQVAPYVWEIQPFENATAIYGAYVGVFVNVIDGTMVVNCSDQTLGYYQKTREEVQQFADRWNSGERWM